MSGPRRIVCLTEEPTEVLEMPSDWPQAALDEPALSLGEFATEPMPLEVVLDAPADAPEPLLMEPLDLSSPAPELAELALPATELPEIELRLDLGEEALQREAAVPESEPEPTLAEPQPPAAAGDLEPTPALGTAIRGDYLRGMARLRGQFLPVLDLERLLGRGVLADLIAPAGAVH